MKLSLTLVAVVLCAVFKVCSGQQPGYGLPKIIPPSPTASSLGKYGEVPVSLYAGLPNISVPIFELQSKSLSVPISLSYHAAGVKVEDIASWVGMGWSLGAGGVITRSVRGFADEYQGRLSNGVPQTPTEVQDMMLMHQYQANQRDAEADVYYYNFNGRSGQLMYTDGGTFYSTTAEKIKFESTVNTGTGQTWILRDEQGTRYLFANVEETVVPGETYNASITAWYLTNIISADLTDTIKFNYTQKFETTGRPASQTFIWHNDIRNFQEPFEGGFQGNYVSSSTSQGLSTLSEIISKKGKVEFLTTATRQDLIGGTELDKIKIYDKDGALKRTFQFAYDFYKKRLFLKSVLEIGNGSEIKSPYRFHYNNPGTLPAINSFSQDYWGFANKGSANPHLIPNAPATFPLTNTWGSHLPSNFEPADRSPDEEEMKKGVLTKIEYPTGGVTEFDFEAHRFTNDVAQFDAPASFEMQALNGQVLYSQPFSVHSPNVSIDISFNNFRQGDNYVRPIIMFQKLVNGTWAAMPGGHWQVPYPSLEDVKYKYNFTVGYENGETYRIAFGNEGCLDPSPNCATPPPTVNYSAYAKVTYFDDDQSFINLGGGLRVKEIRDYVSPGGKPTNIKKFEYSNGLLVSIPIYHYSFYRQRCEIIEPLLGGCYPLTMIVYSATSQSLSNLGTSQGSLVVYPNVREIYGTNGENGYIDNVFSTTGLDHLQFEHPEFPPFLPKNNQEYWQGKLLKQTKFDATDNKLEETENIFKEVPGANSHSITGMKIMEQFSPSPSASSTVWTFYYGYYFMTSKWVVLDTTIHTTFNPSGAITSITKYAYDNPSHIQVTQSTTKDSEGNTLLTKYWYPGDYNSVENIAALLTKNIISSPIKEEIHKNGQIISGKISRLDSDGKPYEIYQYESSSPQAPPTHSGGQIVPPSGYIKKVDVGYDGTSKNINKVQVIDNFPKSYLWGYNDVLPIAEIVNANSTEVAATSFENKAKGNWTYTGPTYSDIVSKTGVKYYKLGGGNVTKSLVAGKYKLEYWAKGTVNLSGGTIATIRTSLPDASGWTLYEKEVTMASTTTLTLSGSSTAFVDELRVYPLTSQITSYTYDPVIGLTSVTNPNNLIEYYEYDSFGRLKWIKDQYGNIVKAVDYHYQGN